MVRNSYENLGVWSSPYDYKEVEKTYLKYVKFFNLTINDLKKPILDVGADKNYFVEYLRRMLGNNQAYGLEKNIKKVDYAQEGIIFGDGLAIPCNDNTFDIVTARNYLHLFFEDNEKTELALKELIRVVKPGGKIMADVFAPAVGLKYLTDPEQLANNSKESLEKKYNGSIFFQGLLGSLMEKGYVIIPKECPNENYLAVINKPKEAL